jgi:hypothetical protein
VLVWEIGGREDRAFTRWVGKSSQKYLKSTHAKPQRTKNSKHETCPEQRRRIRNSKQFQMTKIGSTKSEFRSSKQIQMTRKKHQNVPNNPDSDSSFWNFLDFLIYLAAICFGFRASNLEFTLLGSFRISIFGFRICSAGSWRDNILG